MRKKFSGVDTQSDWILNDDQVLRITLLTNRISELLCSFDDKACQFDDKVINVISERI